MVRTKQFDKDQNFVTAGQNPKSIAFVKKGLFRYYYSTKEGEELTKGFFPKDSVLSSYSAMIEKRPSYFTIQALENSEIEVLNYQDFISLKNENSSWGIFEAAMLQKGFMVKEERERQFLLFDAEQRYISFLEKYPVIEKRVSQNLIASYIGIAPESLSRLRRKMGILT